MEFMIPEIWLELGQYIHQDFLEQFPDFRSGVADFACSLGETRYTELRSFVGDLLQSNTPSAELSAVWEASGASFYVDEREMPVLFSEIAAGLEQCGASS